MSLTILITGANGQMGQCFRRIAATFRQIPDSSSSSENQLPYPPINFVFKNRAELPIHRKDVIEEIIHSIQPDYCINCAAYTAVDKAETERDEAMLINGIAPGILAEVCRTRQTRLVHISTDYVFNGKGTIPYKEDDRVDPVNWYGATKLEGEKRILAESPDPLILRTSWLYSRYGNNFVKTMIRLQSEKPEINVVNDQIGSPTHALDLAQAIMHIIAKCEFTDQESHFSYGGIYHYSNEGKISWFDFATAIKEITSSNCKVNPVPTTSFPTPATRPSFSVMDTSKIKKTFQLEIPEWKTSLEKMIRTLE